MSALNTPVGKVPFTIEMLRDDVRVIESRGGSSAQIKSAFDKVRRLTANIPAKKGTAAAFRKTRESRGK